MIGIYKITSPSGKIYIGQSVNIENRWLIYEKYSNNYKSQRKLYNSIQKYSWENHKKEVIEECSEDQLLKQETYWKTYYKVLEIPSLCCRIDGKGGKNSKETNEKIKQYKINNPISQEGKNKISQGNINKFYSEDSKKKISKSKKGHKCYQNQKWKDNISLAFQNMSIEKHINRSNKISEKTKGKPKPKDFSKKISKPIFQYDLVGNFIKEWPSIKEAELYFYGKSNNSIGACCKGKTKYVKNFKWEYK
jgi:group I intron endonuclease